MCNITMNLAAARKRADMTQTQAAKALNVSVATLCAWEKGRSPISETALLAMALVYDIPRGALIAPKISAKS